MKLGFYFALLVAVGVGGVLTKCLEQLVGLFAIGANTNSKYGNAQLVAKAVSEGGPGAANSATGFLFSGEPFRSFQGTTLFQNGREKKRQQEKANKEKDPQCSQWAVVTTISGPSTAVQFAAMLPGWCTLVVADNNTPNNYTDLAELPDNTHNMHFLSTQDQKKWAQENSKAGKFVKSIPYDHVARKNIGYLYAIHHGAKVIFEFEDDTRLLKDPNGNPMDPLPDKEKLQNVDVPIVGTNVFNHHQLMKATDPNSWPRGFPHSQLKNQETLGKLAYTKDSVPLNKFAVLQFCANNDPDVDAIHRMTKPLPMYFDNTNTNPIQVPIHAFAPYNAQASIHTYDALWAMVLPHSVSGRVSDIWRGYFAQAIFRSLGLSVAFLPPKVRQGRNSHNYLADMQAELDLYFMVDELIEFLNQWLGKADTVPALMEELWIQLYIRGYIELEDVVLVQLWLSALVEIGYEFPPVIRKRIDNVVVMGQFNFASPPDNVVFWVQKWRELFGHVEVRIPYSNLQLEEVRSRGINAKLFAEREPPGKLGWYSTMAHMKWTLETYKDSEDIDGILYIHDDAFLNMTALMGGSKVFPTDVVMASPLFETLGDAAFYIQKDGTIAFAENLRPDAWEDWPWHKTAIPQLVRASKDPRLDPYKLEDGSLPAVYKGQSDFLYVPTSVADDFSVVAAVMLENNVFHEVGTPNIVHAIKRHANMEARKIELCTEFNKRRGTEEMIDMCLNNPSQDYGMYHPFKLSMGLSAWGDIFDRISLGG